MCIIESAVVYFYHSQFATSMANIFQQNEKKKKDEEKLCAQYHLYICNSMSKL